MPFVNKEAREALSKRLAAIAHGMIRARDQGHDGRYYPSDRDIEDIWASAVIITEVKVSAGTKPLVSNEV